MIKNPKRTNRNLLLTIGAILGLGLTLSAFEYKDYYLVVNDIPFVFDTNKDDADIYEIQKEDPKVNTSPQKTSVAPPSLAEIITIIDGEVDSNQKLVDDFLAGNAGGTTEGGGDEFGFENGETLVDEALIYASKMPRFKACKNIEDEEEARKCFDENIQNHIRKHLKYPDIARTVNVQGMVYVRFVIEKNGSVSNFEIVRDIDYGCGQEVVRVLKLLPEFEPGSNGVKPVRISYVMPVNFKLE